MANIFTDRMDSAFNKNLNKVLQTSYITRTMKEMEDQAEQNRRQREQSIIEEYNKNKEKLIGQEEELSRLEKQAKKESITHQQEINKIQKDLANSIRQIKHDIEVKGKELREAGMTPAEIEAMQASRIQSARAASQDKITQSNSAYKESSLITDIEIESRRGLLEAQRQQFEDDKEAKIKANNEDYEMTKAHLADKLKLEDKLIATVGSEAIKMVSDVGRSFKESIGNAFKLVEEYSKAYGGMTGTGWVELTLKNMQQGWNVLNENGWHQVTNALDDIKFSLDLTTKGWNEATARTLANDNQIYKKLDPYLDTTSEAFLNIQQRSDGMVEQVAGMGGYLYDIAGSARVWTANANTIITKLNPIQMWAEKSLLNEQAMAAIEELVSSTKLTEEEATQIVSTAVSVASDPYASITGGSVIEKIAATNAIKSNDYNLGSIIGTIMGTAGDLGNSSDRVAQSAKFTAMGMQNMFSNNADVDEISGNYFKNMNDNTKRTITAQETWGDRLTSFLNGKFTTLKEQWDNLKSNMGSTLAILQVCFPIFSSQLTKIAGLIATQIVADAINNWKESWGVSVISAIAGGTLAVGSARDTVTTGTVSAISAMGSNGYAVGTSYVPYDQVALIHEGEAVLTREQNSSFQKFVQKNGGTVESAISSIEKTEQEEKNDKLISVVREATEQICRVLAYTQGNGNNSKTAESQATKNEYRLVRS